MKTILRSHLDGACGYIDSSFIMLSYRKTLAIEGFFFFLFRFIKWNVLFPFQAGIQAVYPSPVQGWDASDNCAGDSENQPGQCGAAAEISWGAGPTALSFHGPSPRGNVLKQYSQVLVKNMPYIDKEGLEEFAFTAFLLNPDLLNLNSYKSWVSRCWLLVGYANITMAEIEMGIDIMVGIQF